VISYPAAAINEQAKWL